MILPMTELAASSSSRRAPRFAAGLLLALAAFLLAIPAEPVLAQDAPRVLGTYRDWTAYATKENGETMCFIVTDPKEKRLSRSGRRRGDVHFLVAHWPGREIFGQPSVIVGYPLARDATPSVRIGSDRFDLVLDPDNNEVYEERAWAEDKSAEERMVDAMRRGSSMVVSGRSSSGTVSTDRYSLLGFSAAMDRINRECK